MAPAGSQEGGRSRGGNEANLSEPEPRLEPQPAGSVKGSALRTVCPYILGDEFCERLAYYGLTINMVNYLTKVMGLSESESAMQVMLFSGTAYLTPMLGAFLADAYWGRYKTILIFSTVYCIGMLGLAVQATIPSLRPPAGEAASLGQLGVMYSALYIIALGTGGIKPNVAAFGADQFDEKNPKDISDKKSFFMWFYFTVNCGSLVGTTVIVYLQETLSWSLSYVITAACLIAAVICFVVGSPLYKHVKPAGSPFVRIYQVLAASWRNRKEQFHPDAESRDSGLSAPLLAGNHTDEMHHSDSLRWLDKASLQSVDEVSPSRFSDRQVQEVKLVLRMLPIFFTTVIYATVYAQFSSFFIIQGDKMDRNIFGRRIPAASLTIFDTLSILILVPTYEHLLIPFLIRIRKQPTMLQRIGSGMVVAILAMLSAAWVEHERVKHVLQTNEVLSVFYQIPQFVLIGASEVLCMVGQLEFFYDQAPDVMRSMGMALQMLSISLGAYLSGGMTAAVRYLTAGPDGQGGWLPKNLDQGRLDLFFLLLAVCMFVDLLIFLWISIKYVYKEVPHKHYRLRTEDGTSYQEQPRPQSRFAPEGSAFAHSSSLPISTHGRGRQTTNSRQQRHGSNNDSDDENQATMPPSSNTSDPYGRSITVVPESMVLPGPMR